MKPEKRKRADRRGRWMQTAQARKYLRYDDCLLPINFAGCFR